MEFSLSFTLLLAIVGSSSSQTCLVKEERSGEERYCKFPFIYKGIQYNDCTNEDDSQGRLWCSTRTYDDGVHFGGGNYWGICPDGGCPNNKALEVTETTKSKTTIEDEANEKPVDERESVEVSKSVNNTDPNFGTWIPKPERGECGINVLGGSGLGGHLPRPAQYPFMVLLGYEIEGRIYYLCGGSLINRHYVLTAAHCVTGPNKVEQLVFGEHEMGNQGRDCDAFGNCLPLPQIRSPTKDSIKVHEEWDGDNIENGNDIALIRLDKPVDTFIEDPTDYDTRTILAPICLPWDLKHDARKIEAGEFLLSTGWGKITNHNQTWQEDYETHYKTKFGVRTPNRHELILETEKNCTNSFPQFEPETQYCSNGRWGEDSCIGDYGGALFYIGDQAGWGQFFQVGIVSYSALNCGRDKPSLYTKVAPYLDWIEKNLEP